MLALGSIGEYGVTRLFKMLAGRNIFAASQACTGWIFDPAPQLVICMTRSAVREITKPRHLPIQSIEVSTCHVV